MCDKNQFVTPTFICHVSDIAYVKMLNNDDVVTRVVFKSGRVRGELDTVDVVGDFRKEFQEALASWHVQLVQSRTYAYNFNNAP